MSDITIRRAHAADADAISGCLIASITQLCGEDHGDDPDILAAWTQNKTPEDIRNWIASSETTVIVAIAPSDTIAGVGACFAEGRIVLNYVHPDHRGSGVSTALLHWLEQHLRELGNVWATLTATRTALSFYRGAGWQEAGSPEADYGFPGQPMRKQLT